MLGFRVPAPDIRLSGRKSDDGGGKAEDPCGSRRVQDARVLSVLVVDDVEDTRDLYQRYFEFQGARVLTAGEGHAAVRAASAQRPDAIVLDLAMPGMTGWEVIRILKADPATRPIPIVVLSGQGARDSALQAGADSYREKPCLPDELLAEVRRLVAQLPPGVPH